MAEKIVTISIEARFRNPNPPHIFNPDNADVKERMETVLNENQDQLIEALWLDIDRKSGAFHRDFYKAEDIRFSVDVMHPTMWEWIKSWFGRA